VLLCKHFLESRLWLTEEMSADAMIRLQNLRKLKLSAQDLSSRVGWRDLLAGEKSFGEKIARKIEESLSLPRGWLDTIDSAIPQEPSKAQPTPSMPIPDKIMESALYWDSLSGLAASLALHFNRLPPSAQIEAHKLFSDEIVQIYERVAAAKALPNPSPKDAPAQAVKLGKQP
jgi:hypothetical protein